jgi:mannose-6-phosphate isomerase-like protein (cupin superfamily)
MYFVSTNKIKEAIDSVRNQEGKHILRLSEPEGQKYKIDLVVFSNVLPNAEVHTTSADIWYIVEGNGAFILGGELKNGVEKKPNEWVAESIEGGERREVAAGDIVDIPVGIPHQIDAAEKFIAMIIVKIFS